MVKETILVDTSLFIDYFRNQNKDKSLLVELSRNYEFAISVITKFELLIGVKNDEGRMFWNTIFDGLVIFPIDEKEAEKSAEILKYLRQSNKMIGLQDIYIYSSNGY